ncbi:DUF6461 domain-containing protein [Actinoplanes oblitus]|uniref:DUF6461 domain-containing protein n=1 Tax=Actinoplanes oblitus TaxID=3040509 RepID=A0ABY8W634_9ACTN|nr:DUF6461 domain-containing protein [Actinoplanes oblitus]WIM93289.1 DUF6461 domain-containing protein [Actinoplanes oblitus]
MGDEAAEYYDRMLVDAEWGEAFCLTFVRGLDDAALVTAFGGDPSTMLSQAELAQILDTFPYGEEPATLVVATLGEWRIGIEINGCQGNRSEVLRRAAAAGDGVALSVYRNVNGRSEFSYVRHDSTQVVIDQIRPERRTGENPGLLDEYLDGLPFGYEDDLIPEAAGLALAERLTGVRLPFDLMERDLPGAVLALVPDDLVPEGGRGLAALEHPFVQRMLAAPTCENVPAMVAFRARLIAEDAGLLGEPVISEVLAALDANREVGPELRARLRELHERVGDELGAMKAVQDIAAAAMPAEDPRDRFGTTYALRDSDRSLQAVVLRRCALRALRERPPVPAFFATSASVHGTAVGHGTPSHATPPHPAGRSTPSPAPAHSTSTHPTGQGTASPAPAHSTSTHRTPSPTPADSTSTHRTPSPTPADSTSTHPTGRDAPGHAASSSPTGRSMPSPAPAHGTSTHPTGLGTPAPAPAHSTSRHSAGPGLGSTAAYGVMAKEFASWDAEKQRAAARWLARRAFEAAGLDKLDWARPALEALDRGDPLPFPDRHAVFRLISAAALVTATTGLPLDQVGDRLTETQRAELRERIDRAPMAVITIFNTVHPDPAKALTDTFTTALETFDGRDEDLTTELRTRFGATT